MTRSQSRTWLLDLLAGYFTVREIPPTPQYCRGLTIPREVSPTHPGEFNPDVQPLATLCYDWFDDPAWRELIIVKGSQGGLSQAAQNIICKIDEYQLGDVMMVLESLTKSKDLGNERIKEMLRANLGAHIGDERDQLQNRVLKINGVKNHLAGARTSGGVASRTLRFIFGDEVDEWLNELQGNESNALDLLRERCKLVEDAKLLFFSKPRNAVAPEISQDHKLRNRKKQDDGIIWQEFLTGSRHKCEIPCPRCGTYQELTWKQVKFDHCRNAAQTGWDFQKILAETCYECIECKYRIIEDEKVEAVLKQRRWRATNDGTDKFPPVPRKMSAHMSDLYVNSREFPTLTLGELAVKCVTAETVSARRAFRRGTLGLPVELKIIEKADIEKIRRLCGTYRRGTCPINPAFACLQVDVQEHGNLFKWVKLAFTMTDDCYVLDNGITDNGAEIIHILAKPIIQLDENGSDTAKTFTVPGGWIDEGDGLSTNIVLDLCLLRGLHRRLSTCKGRAGRQTDSMADRVVLQKNRTHKGIEIDRYLCDHEYFMDDLYEERLEPWSEHLLKLFQGKDTTVPTTPRLHFFSDADTDLLVEFTTEKKDWHVRNGKLVFGWPPKPEGGKNDFSDCVKDGLAMWYRKKILILKKKAAEAAATTAPAN